MIHLTLNLWLGLNLVIPVWWSGIMLMNLLAPDQKSVSLLNHTFILVSQVSLSTLTHFPLLPSYEDYSFLDQLVEDFGHGMDSILMDTFKMPELDACLDEADAIPSSVSWDFLCSVSVVFDTSRLQLAPNITSHKVCCQARALLLPVPMAVKMSSSKLIHFFFGHWAAFVFGASLPPVNITLNSAN